MSFLAEVALIKKEEVNLRRQKLSEEVLLKSIENLPPKPDFITGLLSKKGGLIAEVKKASPSQGKIKKADAVLRALAYQKGGAAAISVLTDKRFFGGSLADLKKVAATVNLPVLYKDFVVDTYQITEARALGASAVLIIVGLAQAKLAYFLSYCQKVGITPLAEVHTEEELECALAAKAPLIGVNNRDLHTLEIDLSTALKLIKKIPPGMPAVAQSGITSFEEIKELLAAGYKGVLVGTSLMAKNNPQQAVSELLAGL